MKGTEQNMESVRITEGVHKCNRKANHCKKRGKKKGFLVVSTENKALVVRMDCQDASQKSLGNAESRV